MIVKRDLLGVAESVVVDLKVTAIGPAPQDSASVGTVENLALVRLDVVPTVTDRPVEAALWTPRQPMHVMAHQRGANSESRVHCGPFICNAVAINVLEFPEVGNVRVPDGTVSRQHTCPKAIKGRVEPSCVDRGAICATIAIDVLQHADLITSRGEVRLTTFEPFRPLGVHRAAIINSLRGKIIEQPERAGTVVFDTSVDATDLCNKDVSQFIKAKCHGVSNHGLSSEDLPRHAIWHGHRIDRLLSRGRLPNDHRHKNNVCAHRAIIIDWSS
jgi:hypothetical protein